MLLLLLLLLLLLYRIVRGVRLEKRTSRSILPDLQGGDSCNVVN
jgi:hypothetical protein